MAMNTETVDTDLVLDAYEAYEPPTLIKHGSLTELTLTPVEPSGGGGSCWDAAAK
jgi:hypothetical protein